MERVTTGSSVADVKSPSPLQVVVAVIAVELIVVGIAIQVIRGRAATHEPVITAAGFDNVLAEVTLDVVDIAPTVDAIRVITSKEVVIATVAFNIGRRSPSA